MQQTPPTPSAESFFASKSMILVAVGISAVVIVVALGIAVKVIWHQDVFAIVGAGIGGITAHTTGGVIRNIQTDTPLRIGEQQAVISPPSGTMGHP